MATNLNGLTYYKLDASVHGYKGDITKNGGLRGEEIDGNFHFLRGNDVESISFEENNILVIKRYNGEILKAEQSSNQDYDFKYDVENGLLIITKPNGEEIKVDGFKTIININHDETLEGDGSETNPLKISKSLQEKIESKIDSNIKKIEENKVYSTDNTIIVSPSTEDGTNISVNIDNKTIVNNGSGKLSVNSDAFINYNGDKSISVSDSVDGIRTVSLNIHENDDILLNDDNGLYAALRLQRVYAENNDNNKDEIQLVGKDNIIISRIDIADFIKDGFLENVYLDSNDKEKPLLIFIFNTGNENKVISIPVKKLVDIYYAGNGLDLLNHTFYVKIDKNSDEYLTVSNEGIKLSGLKTVINKFSSQINNLINELNNTKLELQKVKDELNDIKSNMITEIKGADNEISVIINNNTATVGFANDAYFIAG